METLIDTTQSNILIAEFMGFQQTGLGWYDNEEFLRLKEGNTFDNLDFHSQWNWLMPVVGRISDVAAGGITYDVHNTLLRADIEKTYIAVVEFIEWYNKRN